MRLIETNLGMAQAAVLLLLLYFLPAIVAWLYRRERVYSIFLLNLLTGWTMLGWVGALKWATIRDSRALEEIAPFPRYRARNRLIVATALFVLCLMIQALYLYVLDVHKTASTTSAMASVRQPTIDPTTVTVIRYVLHKDSQHLIGDFTIRNGNTFKVKDVVVRCVHATIDATVLDTTTMTIQRTFQPNSDYRVNNLDLGSIPKRTANSNCSAQGFALAQ